MTARPICPLAMAMTRRLRQAARDRAQAAIAGTPGGAMASRTMTEVPADRAGEAYLSTAEGIIAHMREAGLLTPRQCDAAAHLARLWGIGGHRSPWRLTGGDGGRPDDALEAAEAALDAAPCGDREVVDLVTDGPPNAGDDTEPVRQRLIARGAQVNGLSVGRDAADWMRESVVSPFGFALAVEDWAGFAAAMRRKLVMELTWSAR